MMMVKFHTGVISLQPNSDLSLKKILLFVSCFIINFYKEQVEKMRWIVFFFFLQHNMLTLYDNHH